MNSPLTAADRNKIINGLMALKYDTLNPAEKLALDIHNTNLALKKALDMKKKDVPVLTNKVDPWEHRSEGMLCQTCMWFVLKSHDDVPFPERQGRCRRHAPTMSGYPVAMVDDWCGDHKLA